MLVTVPRRLRSNSNVHGCRLIRPADVLFVESPHVNMMILSGYPIDMPIEEKAVGSLPVPSLGDPSASGHVRFRTAGQMLWRPDIATVVSGVICPSYDVPPRTVLVIGKEDRK